jgi:uncharacterized protein YdaU (DUF1376 family)
MKSPAFQFYPGDWLSSITTMLMTPEQEGAYIRLLCCDWLSDGIPDDDDALANLSRLGEGWFHHASKILRPCFHEHPAKPGFLTNVRLQKEREKQDAWREKSRQGGLKSSESRSKSNGRVVQANVKRTVQAKANSSSSSSSSSSNKNTPLPPKGEIVPLAFESPEFTQAWSLWETSRRENRKPITPTTRALQMKKLAELGEVMAVATLLHSAENGYTGLFPPKADIPHQSNFSQPPVKAAPPSRKFINHPEPEGDWKKTLIKLFGEGNIPDWRTLQESTQEEILAAMKADPRPSPP